MTTTTHDKFPEALLQASIDTRKAYFFGKTINHPRLERGRRDTLALIGAEAGPDIIIVTGPTGVGKTTLARKIEESILGGYQDRMDRDKSMLPVLRLDAVPGGVRTTFDWKDFYIRLLQAFDEPCIAQKQLFEEKIYTERPIMSFPSMNTAEVLRRSVEKTVQMRQLRVLVIDEAHHMFLSPKDLRTQFERIKSLSLSTQATIVLVGTYDLLSILEQSAQLVRRSRVVHMSRYNDYEEDDQLAFASALFSFQRHMPFPTMPELHRHAEYFYLKSGGCVGILKRWLNMVVENALEEGLDTVDQEYADRFAHSNNSLRTVLEEALMGERKLDDIDLDVLRTMLKRRHEEAGKQPASPGLALVGDGKSKKGRVRGQVGKRNPKRDPVGTQHGLAF